MIDNLIRLILKHSAAQADPKVVNLDLLEAAWPALVGKEMSRRTRPRSWESGTLHIEVSSHAWVQELSFHREALLGKIQRTFPWQLERLHLSVAQDFEPLDPRPEFEEIDSPLSSKPTKTPKPLDSEQQKELVEDLGHLDAEARASLLRIREHIRNKHGD